MNKVKYPDITVELIGQDGNALSIIGRTATALRRGGAERDEIEQYKLEAMSGDYNNVLSTTMQWVNVS